MIDPDLLKYYREEKNLSIRELSNRIRISKNKIREWESGELEPTEKELNYLCKFYKIDINDLLYKDNNKTKLLMSLGISVISIIICFVLKKYELIILLPINLIIIYNFLMIIKKEYIKTKRIKEEIPKSLFGLKLSDNKKERIKIYIIESIILANLYLLFNIVCRILEINNLLDKMTLLKNNVINIILSSMLIIIILSILIFLIEYIIGEIIVKKYKG